MERSVRVPTVVATAVQLTILIIGSYCTVAAKVVVVACRGCGKEKVEVVMFPTSFGSGVNADFVLVPLSPLLWHQTYEPCTLTVLRC